MSVVPKGLPKITKDDNTYPIVLWMKCPYIVCFVNYDMKKNGKISLKEAKGLSGRICYEINDFRHKGVVHCDNRLYFGTVTYTKSGHLKLIQTNKGILYNMIK